MKFTVHTIVKNEDIWVYFAIMSVLDLADKIFIYDTGSTDRTVEIIKQIKSPKIIFEEKGSVDRAGLVKLRQEQLDKTKTDWFLILDGDEVWPAKQLKKTIELAERSSRDTLAIINRVRNCIGDIYHFLPEETGGYKIGRYSGNLNIRLMRKTTGLRLEGIYPLEAYVNNQGAIQEQPEKLVYTDSWYLHTTYLKRSSRDENKTSGSFGKAKLWEKGRKLDLKELPEVLKDYCGKRSLFYELVANFYTPLVSVKRKIYAKKRK